MTGLSDAPPRDPSLPDPTGPLTPSGNLRRRAAVSRVFELGARASALIAVALLAIVVYDVAKEGAPALSLDFLLAAGESAQNGSRPVARSAHDHRRRGHLQPDGGPDPQGDRVRGIGRARDRDAAADRPLEPGGPAARTGEPPRGGRLAGSGPLAHRARNHLANRPWGGIATGAILSIARAAGETAPLLLVDGLFNPNSSELVIFGHGVPNIPLLILQTSDLAIPEAFTRAWGAALVLLIFILLANIGARVLLARTRAKMKI